MIYDLTRINKLSSLDKTYLSGKKIFLRVDFDDSVDENFKLESTFRMERCFPTINYLLENNAKVVLATKLGRPEIKKVSTEVLLPYLNDFKPIFIDDYPGSIVVEMLNKLDGGRCLLLENVRFYEEEDSTKGLDFAKNFAKNFDIYVNEAFAMCHRKDTSIYEIPKYLPSYTGFNLENEITNLSKVSRNFQTPLLLILGGAKLETKIPLINKYLNLADNIFVGGKLVTDEKALEFKKYQNVIVATLEKSGFDIDSKSQVILNNLITKAKTIIYAGPLGKFEDEMYEKGTKESLMLVANSDSYKVAGGGDTISALEKYSLVDEFDFVSTGGGAMLIFLAGENLPGLDVLTQKKIN